MKRGHVLYILAFTMTSGPVTLLCSFHFYRVHDSDFARFSGLRWHNPLA